MYQGWLLHTNTEINSVESHSTQGNKNQGDSQVSTTGKLGQRAYTRELFKKVIKHNSKLLDKYFVQIYFNIL